SRIFSQMSARDRQKWSWPTSCCRQSWATLSPAQRLRPRRALVPIDAYPRGGAKTNRIARIGVPHQLNRARRSDCFCPPLPLVSAPGSRELTLSSNAAVRTPPPSRGSFGLDHASCPRQRDFEDPEDEQAASCLRGQGQGALRRARARHADPAFQGRCDG